MADGKVFLSYAVGTGDILDKTIADFSNLTARENRQNGAVVTDDTVLCAYAATGKTLWKTVIDEGINLYNMRKGGPHNSACWRAGKVYAQSSLGRVHCLDGKTGIRPGAPA